MKTLCIYHANCADGFGAAWCVRHALGDAVEFFPGVYQNLPPDVTGRDVIMVDFSYKRAVVLEMAKSAKSIKIIDHHQSAIEELAGIYVGPLSWEGLLCPITTIFDIERSGATMAWDFFHPNDARPPLLNHIEDRDLWRFRLDGTREIQAAVFSYPYEFGVWDELMRSDHLGELLAEGAAIERKHHKDVAELVGVCKRTMLIGDHAVPAASLPYTLTSDAGHLMARGEPFAACYWDVPEGRVFSLRSTDEGMDVSEIAKQYGGGGHRNAAGFRVPFARISEFEIA